MRDRILPEASRWYEPAPRHDRLWLTTAGAARRLGLTTNGVRRLVRARDLVCEWTESGQRIFRRSDVQRCLLQRTDDQARSRAGILAAVRVHMLTAGVEPRQLPLFGRRPRLTLVPSGERPVQHAEPKASQSFDNARRSEKPSYVNRKTAAR